MLLLPTNLRKELERAIVKVCSITEAQRQPGRALRAKAMQLGGALIKAGGVARGQKCLVEEIYYQQWHLVNHSPHLRVTESLCIQGMTLCDGLI